MAASPQRQVYAVVGAFCVLGACVVVAGALAFTSTTRSNSASDKANAGSAACAYQKAIYPQSREFRLTVRAFVADTITRLKEEEHQYRINAASYREPDVRRGALALAASKHRSWQRDKALLSRVKLLSPPRCKTG